MQKLKWKLAQWLELRWWKNYLKGKDKQQYLGWKKNYWQRVLANLPGEVTITDATTICDLGCGPAGVFIALPQNRVTAVDPLIDEYEKQTPVFSKSDYPNNTFIKSTIEEFDGAQQFDVVFCLNAINHVRDIEKGFRKLNMLCKPSGYVVVSIDAHNFSFFKYLFRFIPGDMLHPHQYNLAEYRQFLERSAMKILKTELLKDEFFFDHYLFVAEK